MSTTSIEDLGPVQPGSVLVVRSFDVAVDLGAMHDTIAERAGHADFVIIGLNEGQTLDLIDEHQMRRLGWVRADHDSDQA